MLDFMTTSPPPWELDVDDGSMLMMMALTHLDSVDQDSALLLRDVVSNVDNKTSIASVPPQPDPPTIHVEEVEEEKN